MKYEVTFYKAFTYNVDVEEDEVGTVELPEDVAFDKALTIHEQRVPNMYFDDYDVEEI